MFLLVLASVIPLAAFSLAVSYALLKGNYDGFVTVVKDRNRAFMSAIDAEVTGHIRTLQAVSASRALAARDYRRFHEELVAVLATQPGWANVVLHAADGRHLVSAAVPWGTPLPDQALQPESILTAIRTLKPVAGNVVLARQGLQRPSLPIRLPVLKNGKVQHVLTAVIVPEAFDSVFQAQRLPSGWASGLVDADGGLIIRIPARPAGTKASPAYLEALSKGDEGWYRGITLDGADTFTAFTKSGRLGWSLGFAIPAEEVLGPVRRGAWLAGGGVLLVLLLGLSAAYWLSRRVARPMAELASSATSLGQGEKLVVPRSSIQEVSELGRALDAAASAIIARDRELRRQASELQAADANKSQFLALLSHELRNPLAPLSNGLSVLKMRGDAQVAARTHAMMERQIVQLRRLIDDLLDVSRIDRGKLELRRERIAVDAVVRNAIETAKPGIETRHHELAVRYAPDALYVEGDAVRLGQVVANLLNNAAKFTPQGGRIEICTRAEGDRAAISVADNGIGFTAEDRARIFDMFVQLDASRTQSAGGLGLGLTLVRSLVEMHGGAIEARSAGLGQGATFIVRLPLAEAPAAEGEAAAALPAGRARGASWWWTTTSTRRIRSRISSAWRASRCGPAMREIRRWRLRASFGRRWRSWTSTCPACRASILPRRCARSRGAGRRASWR
jgi:signal transduction histidine kinase